MKLSHKELAMEEATQRLLKWARDLSSYDTVDPSHGMYHTMQYVAQALAGLRSATENYDATVAFFNKDKSQGAEP